MLVAAIDGSDRYNVACVSILAQLRARSIEVVLPQVCLSEADHLLGHVYAGTDALFAFVAKHCTLEDASQDMVRARAIAEQSAMPQWVW